MDHEGIVEPDLETVLRVVFGISGAELEICLCVMEAGESTTRAVAERLDVDRSLVSRHLNHLVEVGVLEKHRQLRRAGGEVFVYTPTDVTDVRAGFERGLAAWVGAAERCIGELSRQKVESMVDRERSDDPRIFADE